MKESRIDKINRLNTLLEVMNIILKDIDKVLEELNKDDKKGDN